MKDFDKIPIFENIDDCEDVDLMSLGAKICLEEMSSSNKYEGKALDLWYRCVSQCNRLRHRQRYEKAYQSFKNAINMTPFKP